MNAMRQRTNHRLSLFAGLTLFGVACSDVGQDGLVTVGVRPVDEGAVVGGVMSDGTGGPLMHGSDATNEALHGTSTTSRGVLPIAAADALGQAGSGMSLPAASDATMGGAGGASIGPYDAGVPLARNEDECGAIPARPAGNVTSGVLSSSGLIGYDVGAANAVTGLRTTLTVPAQPAPNGQIYVWAGIQPTPNSASFQPIGNGALMSVLTWGALCPSDAPASYSTWWIAPMYSNVSSSDPQYSGCHGGRVAQVKPGQLLDIAIELQGTTWVQTVVNRDTQEASDFSMDLKGQEQGRVFFTIDLPTSNKPTEDLVFTNTVLSIDPAEPAGCQPIMRGSNDFASRARVSTDGKHCCIDRIVLRAPRVAPTTIDPP